MAERHYYKQLPQGDFLEGVGVECVSQWHCQGCGKLSPVESCNNGLDNGLELSGFGGYYGGFTDRACDDESYPYVAHEYDRLDKAHMCHDCCVKLFNTFPHLARVLDINKSTGHHSLRHAGHDTEGDPCCTNCWKWEKLPSGDSLTYFGQLNKDGLLVWGLN